MSVAADSGVRLGARMGGTGRWFSVVVDEGVDGPETAGERVVRMLSRGRWPGIAEAAAGVSAGTLRATLREAAELGHRLGQAEGALAEGKAPGDEGWPLTAEEWPLTGEELAVVEFGRAVAMAKATDQSEREDVLRATVQGEVKRTIVTTKYRVNGDGVDEVVERTERVEEIPPDPDASIKILERLYPGQWSKVDRTETNVSGTVEHVHVDAREVVAGIRRRLAAAKEQGIGADGSDERPVIEATAQLEAGDVEPEPLA